MKGFARVRYRLEEDVRVQPPPGRGEMTDIEPPATPQPSAPTHPPGWFDDLFATHAAAIHRYFLRRTSRNDAEDLAADVLATAWRRQEHIVPGTELAWLYRTAGFILANHRRRHVVELWGDDGSSSGHGAAMAAQDPGESVDDADLARAALAALSSRDREILLLVAWDGISRSDLAAVLGLSLGGADAALSRARARLRERWPAADQA